MTHHISFPAHHATSALLNGNTETDTMQTPNTTLSNTLLRGLAASASALALAGLLTGCGGALSGAGGAGTGGGGATVRFEGNVHGGQQPVNGATIQLYTVGTSGLKSASTPLIGTTVKSDVNGNFSITGKYACTSATQVYIVATAGDPGSGPNPALSMMAALGSCATLQANAATTFLSVNELTTVAAAYALAPFAQDYTHIGSGSSASNVTSLANAFASASNLVNTSTGQMPGTPFAPGTTEPVSELNTLANIIASCVNTTGAASVPCTQLFSATGATETIGAALAFAKNPGSTALTSLYTLSTGSAPFQPTLSSQPKDFTVAINYNAGGAFLAPYGLAIDATGNAWITSAAGTAVTELSPVGSVVTTATATGLYGAQGVAVDKTGNVWVANTAGNSVIKFGLTGGAITTTNSFTSGITAPAAIAMDVSGNAFVANFNGNSVTKLTSAGAPVGSPFTGGGAITVPSALALDNIGNVLVTSGTGSVVKLQNDGTFVASYTDNALQGPLGLAVDPSNRIFVTGSTTGTSLLGAVSEFSSAGAPNAVSPVQGTVGAPFGVATDGTSAWVVNSIGSGGLVQLAFGNGTPLSPPSTLAGFGLLPTPIAVAIDGSGSIWTTNSTGNTVSKFIGLAVPVLTPLAANIQVPQ